MAEKLSAWICMENPEISWRIQMERFIPVEIFRKKVNNTLRGITFFPFLPKRLFCRSCLAYQCQASSR